MFNRAVFFFFFFSGLDQDLASAKALYERMQAEGVKIDELTLKRLAKLYKDSGETVPFEEPMVISHIQ